MIEYSIGCSYQRVALGLCGRTLLPLALLLFIPSGCVAILVHHCLFTPESFAYGYLEELEDVEVFEEDLSHRQMWTALAALMSLVFAFRTSQALARFRESSSLVHQTRAEWFEACSCIVMLSSRGGIPTSGLLDPQVPSLQGVTRPWLQRAALARRDFWHTLIRAISIMHAFALFEDEDLGSDEFELLSAHSLDDETCEYLKSCQVQGVSRVESCLQWLQVLIFHSVEQGVVTAAPPIVARVHRELSRGIVNLRSSRKLKNVSFPSFPLVQVLISIFVLHPLLAAMVAIASFFGFCCLNVVGGQLEQSLLEDEMDLDDLVGVPLADLHTFMSEGLLMMIDPRLPRVPPGVLPTPSASERGAGAQLPVDPSSANPATARGLPQGLTQVAQPAAPQLVSRGIQGLRPALRTQLGLVRPQDGFRLREQWQIHPSLERPSTRPRDELASADRRRLGVI